MRARQGPACWACSGGLYHNRKGKGQREKMVVLKHMLPNALMPIITSIGAGFARMAGSAVIESVFSAWRGSLHAERHQYARLPGPGMRPVLCGFTALVMLAVDRFTHSLTRVSGAVFRR